MNIPFISNITDRLWPEVEPGDFLAPERPEDFFQEGDAVWYFPIEDNYDVAYEAFVERVDYSDNTAYIAYYVESLDDWVNGWRSFDQLVLDDQFPLNTIKMAIA